MKESYQILEELIEKAKDDSNKRRILMEGCKEVLSEMAVDDSIKEFIKYRETDYSLDKLISLLDMVKAGILKIKVGEIIPEEINELPTAYANRNFTHDFVYIGYVYPYMNSQPSNRVKSPMLYIKSESDTKKILEIEFNNPMKSKKVKIDRKDPLKEDLRRINSLIMSSMENGRDFIMSPEELRGEDDTFYSGMSLREYPDGFEDEKFTNIINELVGILVFMEAVESHIEGLEVTRISHNGHLTKYISSVIYGSFVIELNGREHIGITKDDNASLKLGTISDFVNYVDKDGYPRVKRLSANFDKLLENQTELIACVEGIKEFRKMRTEIELGE